VHGKEHIQEIASIRREAHCGPAKNLGSPDQGHANEAMFWQEGSVPARAQEKMTGSFAPIERVAARIRFQLPAFQTVGKV
jgi:hypothetical protein